MKSFRSLLHSLSLSIVPYLLRWTLIVLPLAMIVGSLVALFLWLLDQATLFRWQHEWLLFLLPAAGLLIHIGYKLYGKNSEAGNNLILEEIHEPGGGVPPQMTPLVFSTTILTHLFGGSAGREGTAVQMGGSMAYLLAKRMKLSPQDRRILLMAGIAAGFGAVFGTPVAGAVFALEVLTIGRIRYDALLPCLMASLLADIVCRAWGIHHTIYPLLLHAPANYSFHWLPADLLLLVKVIVAGVCFGAVSRLFATTTHGIRDMANRYIPITWLIPVIGGSAIIALTYLVGTTDYLGLGVVSPSPDGNSIVHAFTANGVTPWSWCWKFLFTTITLGMGFKGGEVTPLFFIGAALGNTLAVMMGVPVDLLAGLGFIAVFAGATNTPLAATILGIELFGGDQVLYYAVACFTAYYFSGHHGIYTTQRMAVDKRNGSSL